MACGGGSLRLSEGLDNPKSKMHPQVFLSKYPDFGRIEFKTSWGECAFFYRHDPKQPFSVREYQVGPGRDDMEAVNAWARANSSEGVWLGVDDPPGTAG